MLIVSHLSRKVATHNGHLTILDDISFQVTEGESVAIIGASGSGKSTLLSLLAGLDQPSSGDVEISGQSISKMDEDERAIFRASNIGFVFQSFHLLPTLTALENVALPLELKGATNAMERAEELLSKVGLADRLTHYPKQMSGGEQQRVAIARAFASEPKVLFADEPTGNLDTKTGLRIADLLFEMNETQGTTLVLVTHDRQLALRCQRRLELEAGSLILDSSVAEEAQPGVVNA
ncbi:ABC transporter ATP-binding protein [Pleionea sp. CnH1-48]|uniref:ABC transporter ATP-binding protein n=1 Tax=Pleionea sp. CnH1-48 TaxID=2954494 RepID=UPI0020985FDC|nr:ABC transporter ATP-binding protein [Pleionea sp. CnH1-48]MCO7225402.1 ABC transporter ATP-binding protein [Pleionea sp. CnH1-48]